MIANIGIIGLASYLLIWVTLITYAVFGFISVVKQGQKENERLARIAGISGGLFALAVGQLFFSFNAVLFFAIIVLAALLRVELGSYCNWFEKSMQGEVIPKKDSRIGLAGLFFLLATVLLLTVWAGKYRYASHIYAGSQGEPDSIVRASQLSPGRYQYQIALAAALRHRFDGLPESSYEDKSETINLAAEAARAAVKKAPYSASAWQILAGVYGVIAPGSREAASVAQEALGQAISIDANNPVLPETAGAIYYQSGNYSEAQKAYQRSLILKPGYYPAALGLARTYLAQDKPEKSLPLLEELSRKESSPDIYLFMGKAYFNVGRLEEARENFQKVLAFSPNNSNALYSLGLVYEQAGETGQALHYFQKVQDLNPENQEVKAKIEELEKESE
jgi:tetratricopeptide (TPR) repeat protein